MEEADDAMNSRTLPKSIKGKELETDEHEREKWKKQINDHKECVVLSPLYLVPPD